MIAGVSEKHSISSFKFPQALLQTPYHNCIRSSFAEFRAYPRITEINSGADYSCERAIYVAVLEWKLTKKLIEPHLPHLKEYLGVLRDCARNGIDKFQAGSVMVLSQSKAFELLAQLETLLNSATGKTDIVAELGRIPHIDYLMIVLTRRIIKTQAALKQQQQLQQCSVIEKIPFEVEALRSIVGAFRVIFNVYNPPPLFREPQMQDAVFIGMLDGVMYSFYTYTTKPVIRLEAEQNIRLPIASEIRKVAPQPALSSSKSQIRSSNTNILQSTIIQSELCELCHRNTSQAQSIQSNFKRYCKACIINPQVDLSMIPEDRITKFIKQHRVDTSLPLVCPSCEKAFQIKDYNPAKKPSLVRCDQCREHICIKHYLNSFICFCMCGKCKIPTYIDDRLQLKLCLGCKRKYCVNCKDGKCGCRCQKCYQLDDLATHKCQLDQVCHECFNTFKGMANCSCGRLLCRNCALPCLESTSDGKIYYRCPAR